MVNANELRVGNWVGRTAGEMKVIGITDSGALFEDTDCVDFKYLEPIPITTEILEGCGFVEDKEYLLLHHPVLKCRWVTQKLFNNLKIETPFLRFDSTCRPPFGCTDIYYLHQLQNLYFSLTGNELEVKLIINW